MRPSLLCIAATISWLFIPVLSLLKVDFSRFIGSHRIAASLGSCSLHPIVTAVCVISSHLILCRVVSSQRFHLISSHVFSPFLSSSQLITPVLMSSYVIRAFLISSQLIWTLLFSVLLSFSILRSSSQLSSSQLFSCQVVSTHPISSHLSSSQIFSALLTTVLSSSHPMSANLISSHLFSALLTSSKLFSHLSADLSSSHLISAHSQIISVSGTKPAPKPDGSRRQSHKSLRSWRLKKKERLQKNVELLAQQQCRATLTQPLQCKLKAARCKRPWKYVCNSNAEQVWRSHSNAICGHQAAEAKRIMLATANTCSKSGSLWRKPKK